MKERKFSRSEQMMKKEDECLKWGERKKQEKERKGPGREELGSVGRQD
jgi:hypothetical protein